MAWIKKAELLFLIMMGSGVAHADSFVPTTAKPGDTVTLSGGNARPNSAMSGYLSCNLDCGQIHIGVATADGKGNYSLTFKVPASVKAGAAAVSIGCDACGNGWRTVLGLQLQAGSAIADPVPVQPPKPPTPAVPPKTDLKPRPSPIHMPTPQPVLPPVPAPAPTPAPDLEKQKMVVESYHQAFSREPDSGEMQFWLAQRVRSVDDIMQLHRSFIKQDEAARKALTAKAYQGYFRRDPTEGEIAYWNNKLRVAGMIYTEIIAVLSKAPPPRCTRGIYVIDGTESKPEDNNFMTHLYRWSVPNGCVLVKHYYSGISLNLGEGSEVILADAVKDICAETASQTSIPGEVPPVTEVAIVGFSRGAIVAVNVANRIIRNNCSNGADTSSKVKFVGLVDPVATSMTFLNWEGALQPGVAHAIQVTKQPHQEMVILNTFVVGNIKEEGIPDMNHVAMTCLQGDKSKPNFKYVEHYIISNAQLANFGFVDNRPRFGPTCSGPGGGNAGRKARLMEILRP